MSQDDLMLFDKDINTNNLISFIEKEKEKETRQVGSIFLFPDKILFGSVHYKKDIKSPNGFIHIGDQLIILNREIF